jgi:hypothetical protein
MFPGLSKTRWNFLAMLCGFDGKKRKNRGIFLNPARSQADSL